MKVSLFLLYLVYLCGPGVKADNEVDIKKGTYPYMAFIYYSDPSIVDSNGARFMRSAVLIHPEWLVTSALGPSTIGTPNGFPKKTLLARVGAVTIDDKFTVNEDEDEQEGEIIQVIRPFNMSSTQWWTTDISLLKSLLPFNVTMAVDVKPLNFEWEYTVKNCFILIYTKRVGSDSGDKSLMQVPVELQQPSLEKCGSHWAEGTMTCATTSSTNNTSYDDKFCVGNSGGPLVCDGEVRGLQTYIDSNCSSPHLYQLVSAWETFVTCGVNDQCLSANCTSVCDVTLKDPAVSQTIPQETVTEDAAPPETTVDNTTVNIQEETTFSSNNETETVTETEIVTQSIETTKQPAILRASPTHTATVEEKTTEVINETLSTMMTPEANMTTNETVWPTVKLSARGSEEDETSDKRKPQVKHYKQYVPVYRAPPAAVSAAWPVTDLLCNAIFAYLTLVCLN